MRNGTEATGLCEVFVVGEVVQFVPRSRVVCQGFVGCRGEMEGASPMKTVVEMNQRVNQSVLHHCL